METVYVLLGHGGAYSDQEHWVVAVYTTLDKAVEHQNRLRGGDQADRIRLSKCLEDDG